MTKIKLTKGELKRQRDSLKQFEHYLPILLLKKQQLQIERERIRNILRQKIEEIDALEGEISDWSGLLNEEGGYIANWVRPRKVVTKNFNIAGIDIPVLERVDFEEPEYDLYVAPLWVDIAIEKIKALVVLLEEEQILKSQIEILERELRITVQRVNLFEKVKIPECKENVRIIRIYLGEQETNAVGRSKIAKNKIEKLVLEEAIA
ncbi:MAG: V-type ATP synthase subunit D [Candidatus Omnitrophica bacterium]|nr:V-type ATP synthase subunit D [Candidatus Omnitrophota bacterium]MBU4148778.1 V-type ATP synthase subunit D [Candidatus Omnitrophota bacterium]